MNQPGRDSTSALESIEVLSRLNYPISADLIVETLQTVNLDDEQTHTGAIDVLKTVDEKTLQELAQYRTADAVGWLNNVLCHLCTDSTTETLLRSNPLISKRNFDTLSLLGIHQHALLAQDTSTPPHILHRLAICEEWTRPAVAKNANTSAQTFSFLVACNDTYTLMFVANNINAPAHILASLLFEGSQKVRANAAANPATPLSALTQTFAECEGDGDMLLGLANNAHASADLLEELYRSGNTYVMNAVCANPNTPVHILERELYSNRGSSPLLGQNEALPAWMFDELLDLPNEDGKYREGGTGNQPSVGNCSTWTTCMVAKNPAAPPNILSRIFIYATGAPSGDAASIFECLARNPHTPARVMVALAGSPNRVVLSALAENPQTPPGVLERIFTLCDEESTFAKEQLVGNVSTPLHIVEKLATDYDYMVRGKVAQHSRVGDTVRKTLSEDSHPWVRYCALQALGRVDYSRYRMFA